MVTALVFVAGLTLSLHFSVGAAADGPAAATVVISPLAGTPDADPATQISFLGAPASQLHDIVVTGSRSGPHTGRLAAYSTHTGGSFLPAHPFEPGEQVTVSATLAGDGTTTSIGTSFTVSSPYTLPIPRPEKPVPVTATNVQRFRSRTDLEPAAVTVTTPAADPALGDIFVSPNAGPGQDGAMIVAPSGRLVWFHPLPDGTKAFDLKVQSYEGAPVLTWWQGQVVEGHGQGEEVIDSTRYTTLATVNAGNGLRTDLHDFVITPQGTAWLTAFAPQHWDLRPFGGARHALIDDGVVQEVDIKTGLVMFQWNALGHVPISDTYMSIQRARLNVLDYFHVNSIDVLASGDLLISARNTWTTYLIDHTTGAVTWRLGGRESSFTLGSDVNFAWQHDAHLLADGTISLFDNESAPAEATQSRAVDLSLDPATHSATLVRQFTHPGTPILADSQGDVQQLDNGDVFIGWGQAGDVSQLSAAGELTFDMHFAPPANSYRAYRYVWDAQPVTQPALALADAGGGRTRLYASWNGATGVAAWRVLAGASRTTMKTIGTYPAHGFETAITVHTAAPYVRVQALASTGARLRTSPMVKR